jgi:hypothetical protein
MKNFATIITAAALLCAIDLKADNATNENTIYDPNPNHLWNRLNETLFERTAQDGKKYGLNELDILYWFRTTNLLAGTSHQQALSVLDEFINSHGEKLIRDPLKRALLQRDLWQLFDWSASPWPRAPYVSERKELQNRLAVAIRRLALTTNEIASLPNNYARTEKKSSDLPRGLFETNGDWVNLAPDPNGFEEIAPTHDHSSQGHSAFLVMLHLPEGRQTAISYLHQLHSFEHFWIYQTNKSPFATTNDPREILTISTNLPQFPTNTEWAIVRRMFVIDTDGNIQPTPITESIQLRRYLAIAPPTMLGLVTNRSGGVSGNFILPQKLYEFQMNCRQNGELREVTKDEKDFLFVHFMGMGFDPFEWKSDDRSTPDSSTFKSTVLESCRTCHMGTGIYSVNSYVGLFHQHFIEPPQLYNLDATREMDAAINWKQEQFNWGLLKGIWNQPN